MKVQLQMKTTKDQGSENQSPDRLGLIPDLEQRGTKVNSYLFFVQKINDVFPRERVVVGIF